MCFKVATDIRPHKAGSTALPHLDTFTKSPCGLGHSVYKWWVISF